jgi:hypothetical protein
VVGSRDRKKYNKNMNQKKCHLSFQREIEISGTQTVIISYNLKNFVTISHCYFVSILFLLLLNKGLILKNKKNLEDVFFCAWYHEKEKLRGYIVI